MKGNVVDRFKFGECFWYGGVRFKKLKTVDDELVECFIFNTTKVVYISKLAYVYKQKPMIEETSDDHCPRPTPWSIKKALKGLFNKVT